MLPGLGDVVSAVLSAYVIYEARRLGVRRSAIARMIGSVALDMSIGALPLVDDAADVFWPATPATCAFCVRIWKAGWSIARTFFRLFDSDPRPLGSVGRQEQRSVRKRKSVWQTLI